MSEGGLSGSPSDFRLSGLGWVLLENVWIRSPRTLASDVHAGSLPNGQPAVRAVGSEVRGVRLCACR